MSNDPDAREHQTSTHDQPDGDASSDGDRSWTEDPITVDPDQDRSVDAVISQQSQARPGQGAADPDETP